MGTETARGAAESASRPTARRHPVYALAGLRRVRSEHTTAEDGLLREWAARSSTIVELGVAEGASARSMRSAMPATAVLSLVDPYLPGRLRFVSVARLVAHRHVGSVHNGSFRWIRSLSWDAGRQYRGPAVDLLFVDADHTYDGVRRDWEAWSVHVSQGGAVAFHDSRVFEGGWLTDQDGPVRFVQEIVADGRWVISEAMDSLTILVRARTRIDPDNMGKLIVAE